jgi:hypothetical protein
MINHFFLSDSEHNERLIEVLTEKLNSGEMDEETAKRIAKDQWRSNGSRIFGSSKKKFSSIFEKSLLKLAVINENTI